MAVERGCPYKVPASLATWEGTFHKARTPLRLGECVGDWGGTSRSDAGARDAEISPGVVVSAPVLHEKDTAPRIAIVCISRTYRVSWGCWRPRVAANDRGHGTER